MQPPPSFQGAVRSSATGYSRVPLCVEICCVEPVRYTQYAGLLSPTINAFFFFQELLRQIILSLVSVSDATQKNARLVAHSLAWLFCVIEGQACARIRVLTKAMSEFGNTGDKVQHACLQSDLRQRRKRRQTKLVRGGQRFLPRSRLVEIKYKKRHG